MTNLHTDIIFSFTIVRQTPVKPKNAFDQYVSAAVRKKRTARGATPYATARRSVSTTARISTPSASARGWASAAAGSRSSSLRPTPRRTSSTSARATPIPVCGARRCISPPAKSIGSIPHAPSHPDRAPASASASATASPFRTQRSSCATKAPTSSSTNPSGASRPDSSPHGTTTTSSSVQESSRSSFSRPLPGERFERKIATARRNLPPAGTRKKECEKLCFSHSCIIYPTPA